MTASGELHRSGLLAYQWPLIKPDTRNRSSQSANDASADARHT